MVISLKLKRRANSIWKKRARLRCKVNGNEASPEIHGFNCFCVQLEGFWMLINGILGCFGVKRALLYSAVSVCANEKFLWNIFKRAYMNKYWWDFSVLEDPSSIPSSLKVNVMYKLSASILLRIVFEQQDKRVIYEFSRSDF